jgi:hypothetical protein
LQPFGRFHGQIATQDFLFFILWNFNILQRNMLRLEPALAFNQLEEFRLTPAWRSTGNI